MPGRTLGTRTKKLGTRQLHFTLLLFWCLLPLVSVSMAILLIILIVTGILTSFAIHSNASEWVLGLEKQPL